MGGGMGAAISGSTKGADKVPGVKRKSVKDVMTPTSASPDSNGAKRGKRR